MLLSGEYQNPSDRVKRLTTSFGSDLVYSVSCGMIKPLKKILLPFAVKSLTGNVELIHALNRPGHSDHTQNTWGDWYNSLFAETGTVIGIIALPRYHFSTLAWDNIDRLEEIISGKGTSYRVNGIAVQAKLVGTQQVKVIPSIAKSKQRSINWASEASPTLGCSIEISRDIYIYRIAGIFSG